MFFSAAIIRCFFGKFIKSSLFTLFAQRTKTLHSVYLSFLYQFTVTIQGFIGEHCFCWLPMKA